MGERFFVKEIYICPFDRVQPGKLKPNLKDYPTRICVIDDEKEVAIDVKTGLKYDYIKTTSHLYFLSQSYEKIKEDKRVAVLPLMLINDDSYDLREVVKIINRLKRNENFQDGNEAYGNEQYLEYINQEKEIELEEQQYSHSKQKKLGKRKK